MYNATQIVFPKISTEPAFNCSKSTMETPEQKPTTLLKVALLHGCFSRFLNCTNGSKSRTASHMWNQFKGNKQPERRQWHCFGVFIVSFEQISHMF